MSKPELKFKLIIVGDQAVGKTCMLLKYVDNNFPETHLATIGVEYKNKTIETNKYKVNLQIWDTAGQERFKAITKSFFQNTNGIIFVYDITKRETFQGVKDWIKDSEIYGKYSRVLVGNKTDLNEQRKVKFDELKEFGLKKKIEVIETSAKNGTNINEVFQKVVDLLISSHTEEELLKEFASKGQDINLTKAKNQKKKILSNVEINNYLIFINHNIKLIFFIKFKNF